MGYSPITYTGNGSTTNFAIPFTYQSEGDIVVTVEDVEVSFTFASASVVSLASAPASGDRVRIERNTNDDTQAIIWNDAVALTSQQLNTAVQQIFFIAQEAKAIAGEATIFESDPQTITSGGLLTLPHGLSRTPTLITGRLINVDAVDVSGWAVGEGPMVPFGLSDAYGGINSVWADATNVYVRFSSADSCFTIGNKGTGVWNYATNSQWNLIVNARI